jgi:activator of HSP90 ATPase
MVFFREFQGDSMTAHIHQEQTFAASPDDIFTALTLATEFSAMTGAPAQIDPAEGGEFSLFGGAIHGRNIECVPGTRLVQAWRASTWDDGVYSVVRFQLAREGGTTKVVLDHAGFPDGTGEHLDAGWHPNYWEPLARRFP